MVAVLVIPEKKQAVTPSIAVTGLLGNSLKSLDGSLSMQDRKVLSLIMYRACDGRIVVCKHT